MKNRVVCITGAHGRLGREFAKAFDSEGWEVVKTGRHDDCFPHDVCSEDDTIKLRDHIAEKYGHLNLLINNAAVFHSGAVDKIKPEQFLDALKTNIYGQYLQVHYLLPLLKKADSPMIINVSSTSGHRADPGSSAYNASKFGLRGFSDSIRKELRKFDIRVTTLSPSSIYFGDPPSDTKLNGSDIAKAALFLANSSSSALYQDLEMWATNP